MFDCVCTLYNRYPDRERREERWARRVLRGVSWQGAGAVRERKNPSSGNVAVWIPFDVRTDGAFAPPERFGDAPDGRWTLREGDLLLRGIGEDIGDIADALKNGAATIVSVSARDFGSPWLRHWEVCAR